MQTRTLAVARGPQTVDEATRSVEVVMTTEQPVDAYLPERGGVFPEVLLARGMGAPKNAKVPFLDTHDRGSLRNVLGSAREFRVESGQVSARVYFADTPAGREAFGLYRDGHATDVSVGYRTAAHEWLAEGETRSIAGVSYQGPLQVATSWALRELSACPIGADDQAKARSADAAHETNPPKETNPMSDTEKTLAQVRAEEERATKLQREVEAAAYEKAMQRSEEIDAMCAEFQCEDLAREYKRGRWSLDEVRADFVKQLAKRAKQNDGVIRTPVTITRDERDTFREMATNSLLFRTGKQPAGFDPGTTELTNRSLVDLARECLRIENKETRGDVGDLVKRAMTTSDFTNILGNVQNKFLFAGFDEAETSYQTWCDVGSLPDYKQASFPRVGSLPSLAEVNPNSGEYKMSYNADATENVTLKHWGGIIPLSLEAVVNDDLMALTDTPRLQGDAAARTINQYVYDTVLQASSGVGETMGDAVALFNAASHSNYVASGSGAAPSLTTFNTAATAMAKQRDTNDSAYLNIRPVFILAPYALKATIDNLLMTVHPTAVSATTSNNPWNYLKPVYDAEMDGNIATWWALAGAKGKTVRVFGRGGAPRPTMERKEGWYTAGIEYRVKLDFVAKALDWRALYANYGA